MIKSISNKENLIDKINLIISKIMLGYYTILFLISSFFCCVKDSGMPFSLACALSNSSHSSPMNSLAFFPLRNPVRLICIFFGQGNWERRQWKRERENYFISHKTIFNTLG